MIIIFFFFDEDHMIIIDYTCLILCIIYFNFIVTHFLLQNCKYLVFYNVEIIETTVPLVYMKMFIYTGDKSMSSTLLLLLLLLLLLCIETHKYFYLKH